jgi:parallel beta-helix repeat protein
VKEFVDRGLCRNYWGWLQGIVQIMRKILLFLLFPIFLYGQVMDTFYVDSTIGDDSNDGLDSLTAFKTITKINSLSFLPGSMIRFKGEFLPETLNVGSVGKKDSLIVYNSYGGSKAKFTAVVFASSVKNVVFRNIEISNAPANGITTNGADSCFIDSVLVQDCGSRGLHMDQNGGDYPSWWVVTNSSFIDNGERGAWVGAQGNTVFSYCHFDSNTSNGISGSSAGAGHKLSIMHSSAIGNGIHGFATAGPTGATQVFDSDTAAYNNCHGIVDHTAHAVIDTVRNCLMHHNSVPHNGCAGLSVGYLITDSVKLVATNNVIYNNDYGVYLIGKANNIFIKNIVYGSDSINIRWLSTGHGTLTSDSNFIFACNGNDIIYSFDSLKSYTMSGWKSYAGGIYDQNSNQHLFLGLATIDSVCALESFRTWGSGIIGKLKLSDGIKVGIEAGKKLKLLSVNTEDISGSAGALDSIVSTSLTVKCTLDVPGTINLHHDYIKNVVLPVGDVINCPWRNGCRSGGGNY